MQIVHVLAFPAQQVKSLDALDGPADLMGDESIFAAHLSALPFLR